MVLRLWPIVRFMVLSILLGPPASGATAGLGACSLRSSVSDEHLLVRLCGETHRARQRHHPYRAHSLRVRLPASCAATRFVSGHQGPVRLQRMAEYAESELSFWSLSSMKMRMTFPARCSPVMTSGLVPSISNTSAGAPLTSVA